MSVSRSENMSRIRGSGTGPETALAAALADAGVLCVVNGRIEGIRPDIVVAHEHRAIFVDGCFWHGCPDHYVRPRSNADFWARKLAGNVERDRRQTARLEQRGWIVVRVWEHMVFEHLEATVALALGTSPPGSATADLRVVRVDVVSEAPLVERRVLASLRATDVSVADRIGPRITAKWRRPRPGATPKPRSAEAG